MKDRAAFMSAVLMMDVARRMRMCFARLVVVVRRVVLDWEDMFWRVVDASMAEVRVAVWPAAAMVL